ncbi:hypothetical protein GCM10027347_59370 [Larkinella harenae]
MEDQNGGNLKKSADKFLGHFINSYATAKEGDIVTESFDPEKIRSQALDDLEDLRFQVDEASGKSDDETNEKLSQIELLIQAGSNIDNFLNASQSDMVQEEIEDTLIEDDGEPETRNRLDQDSVDNAGYKYDQLRSLFDEDIIKLYDLMQDY